MRAPWSRTSAPISGLEPTIEVPRALLISIQPRFAEAILDGTKTIELRRTRPTLPENALALIYASTPIKALVGYATVEEVVEATPQALWREHRDAAGVTTTEFKTYFAHRTVAYGLRLSAATRAEHEMTLAQLRQHGLEPPQSWRYVTPERAEVLHQALAPTPQTKANLLHRVLAPVTS